MLKTNGRLVAGTGLEKIIGDASFYTAGFQTATLDANHIYKTRYSIQLAVVPIYVCIKAHEASNFVLPLYIRRYYIRIIYTLYI